MATAVQVENTVASPVVSQSILPGTPFSAQCSVVFAVCSLSPATPAGYTFHATYITAINSRTTTVTLTDQMYWAYTSGGNSVVDFEVAALGGSSTVTAHVVDWYIGSWEPPYNSNSTLPVRDRRLLG